MATDLLARIRSEIDERLAQLRPLLSEYERLTAAAETLAAVDASPLAAVGTAPRLAVGTAPRAAVGTAPRAAVGTAPRAAVGTAPRAAVGTAPRAAVDTDVEDPYAETPLGENPYAPPARDVPEFPAEAPTRSAEAPLLPAAVAVDPAEEPPTPALRRAYPLRGSDGGVKLAMSLRTTPLQRPTPRPNPPAAAPAPSATQILERPASVPPAVEGDTWEPSTHVADHEPAREPATPAGVRQAILAALEHGSHTATELVMVTAMSTPEIRGGLIRLTGRGAITKVKRRGDGKTAYALPFSRA